MYDLDCKAMYCVSIGGCVGCSRTKKKWELFKNWYYDKLIIRVAILCIAVVWFFLLALILSLIIPSFFGPDFVFIYFGLPCIGILIVCFFIVLIASLSMPILPLSIAIYGNSRCICTIRAIKRKAEEK